MKKAIGEIPKITGTVIKGFDCRAREAKNRKKHSKKREGEAEREKSDMFREFFQCA